MGAASGSVLSSATGLVSSGADLASSFIGAAATRDSAEFQLASLSISARMARLQAKSAIRTGEQAATRVKLQGRQLSASQRAGIAAGGVDVLSGSAQRARIDTEFFTDLDEITVKDVAWQRAFGARVQASDLQFSGLMAAQSGSARSRQRLLAGTSRFAADIGQLGLGAAEFLIDAGKQD